MQRDEGDEETEPHTGTPLYDITENGAFVEILNPLASMTRYIMLQQVQQKQGAREKLIYCVNNTEQCTQDTEDFYLSR